MHMNSFLSFDILFLLFVFFGLSINLFLWRCVWPSGKTPRTLDRDSSLAIVRRVVSSDKELYSTVSLFTQVYKWIPATYCWG